MGAVGGRFAEAFYAMGKGSFACLCGGGDQPKDEPMSKSGGAAKAAAKPVEKVDVSIKCKVTLVDGAEHSFTAQPPDKINQMVLKAGGIDHGWNLAEMSVNGKSVNASQTFDAAGLKGSVEIQVTSVRELSGKEMWEACVEDICHLNKGIDQAKALKAATYNGDGTIDKIDAKILGIKDLPDSVCSVKTSGDFNLNENKLAALPARFGDIVCGGKLDLSNNLLKTLPKDFHQLTVKTLRFEDNKIAKLPADFCKIKISRNLLMGYNKIKELPKEFGDIEVGNEIHVYGNPCVSQKTKVDWPKLKGKVQWNDPN